MGDLTAEELRRIQRTLRRRYRVSARTNIIDIGFGAALKNGEFQPGRGFCATFLVRKKKTPRRKIDRIAAQVKVRLRRGQRFIGLTFNTDVVEVGRIVATGRRLEYKTKHVTTGVIVAWRSPAAVLLSWGLVTVGHVLPPLRTLAASRRRVTIRTSRGNFFGTIIAKSDNDREIDSAIALVERRDLIAKQLMTASQSRRRIVPRSLAQLQTDHGKTGETLRVGRRRAFIVHAYFPSLPVPQVGNIVNVLSVLSRRTQTFEQGTSGSCWRIQDQASCMQVAARAPNFDQGFGQSLDTIVQWAAGELEAKGLLQPGSFRTVATF